MSNKENPIAISSWTSLKCLVVPRFTTGFESAISCLFSSGSVPYKTGCRPVSLYYIRMLLSSVFTVKIIRKTFYAVYISTTRQSKTLLFCNCRCKRACWNIQHMYLWMRVWKLLIFQKVFTNTLRNVKSARVFITLATTSHAMKWIVSGSEIVGFR